MKIVVLIAAVALSATAAPVFAQQSGQGAAAPATAAAADMTSGEVRRVDKVRGVVVLKHGEIKNLNMGAMTMTFKLQDPAIAGQLNVGDKVTFTAIQKGDELIVTSIRQSQ